METMEMIKEKINSLAQSQEIVHINVSITHPRVRLKNVAVKVVGTYSNVFRIEEIGHIPPKYYSLQYTDVLIGQIKFTDLNES
ncbi:MAG: hypothetical protein ACI3XQ_08265 [Eubacteriales bacterium]